MLYNTKYLTVGTISSDTKVEMVGGLVDWSAQTISYLHTFITKHYNRYSLITSSLVYKNKSNEQPSDILNETIIYLYNHIPKIYELILQGGDNIQKYISQIIKLSIISPLSPYNYTNDNKMHKQEILNLNIIDDIDDNIDINKLYEIFNSLYEEERQFILDYISLGTFKRLGEAYEIKIGTVKYKYHKIIRRIKAQYNNSMYAKIDRVKYKIIDLVNIDKKQVYYELLKKFDKNEKVYIYISKNNKIECYCLTVGKALKIIKFK